MLAPALKLCPRPPRVARLFRPLSAATRTKVTGPRVYDPADPPLERFQVTRSGHFNLKDAMADRDAHLETYDHPSIPKKKFVKSIRTPHGLYASVYDVVKEELKQLDDLSAFSQGVSTLLSEKEKQALLDSLLANMLFPKSVSKYAHMATKATMLFPSCIYTHMSAGLGNYCMDKMGGNIDESYRYVFLNIYCNFLRLQTSLKTFLEKNVIFRSPTTVLA